MSSSTLALLGGEPVSPPPAPPHPHFSEEAIARVTELLRRGATVGLSKGCTEIAEAESAIAAWQGVPHCLGTISGHAALHSALIGLEVTGGDEVITTPYTWGASVSCILHNNAVPVFADVDPETGLLDPDSAAQRVTRRTRAILVVHIFGQPANLTALRALADRHGLKLIEDGSQAHGAIHAGRKVGSFGDASGFSCMGGKLLATTEAGYMVTPHEGVYWRAALSGQHMGRSGDPGFPEELRPYVDSLVYTYRLSPINAVLLTEQLRSIDAQNEARERNVGTFRSAMAGVRSVRLPTYPKGDRPVYHMLTMNFDADHAGVSRGTYVRALGAEGVSAWPYVPSPIPTWARLAHRGYAGPRVMWTGTLAAAGVEYSGGELPNAALKVARSIEMGWNYTVEDPAAMRALASAFLKVEENLPALRDYEKREGFAG